MQIQLPNTNLLLDILYQASHESSHWLEVIALFFLSHSDIRLDLQIYNQEPDDEKLVDLLVLFGYPFPPAAMAENEAASSGSTSESEVVLKLDPAAIPCGSIYPALETTDEVRLFLILLLRYMMGFLAWKVKNNNRR